MKGISELAKDALELPSSQRIMLARILLELADDEQGFDPAAEAAWEEEICRRMRAVEAGAVRTKSFDEVFADLDHRFPA
jgi:hypothetical protein